MNKRANVNEMAGGVETGTPVGLDDAAEIARAGGETGTPIGLDVVSADDGTAETEAP